MVYIDYLKSAINYSGCKYKLLPQLIPLFPIQITTFIDMFCGSGTVSLNVEAEHYYMNDINHYITSILQGIKEEEYSDFMAEILRIIDKHQLSKTNQEGFLELREHYNKSKFKDWKELYTLLCYSFNYQFRCNNNHEFNSSFGKDRSQLSGRQMTALLGMKQRFSANEISISSVGMFDFIDYITRVGSLQKDTLFYLDPPYFNSCGNYNDGKRGFENWTITHEKYLLYTLIPWINSSGYKFALSNDLAVNTVLYEWLKEQKYNVHKLDNSYSNSNYQKKDKSKKTCEVLITNY